MSCKKYIVMGVFGAGVVLFSGCRYDKTASEPLSTPGSVEWASDASFRTQANNAVLTSMTVADIHFVPYSSELNSLGRARLTAIARNLELHGGEVVVDIRQSDEPTRQERLESVRKFLVVQGLDSERLIITAGLTRGRGQDATEATLFYKKNLLDCGSGSSTAASQGPAALGAVSGESGAKQ